MNKVIKFFNNPKVAAIITVTCAAIIFSVVLTSTSFTFFKQVVIAFLFWILVGNGYKLWYEANAATKASIMNLHYILSYKKYYNLPMKEGEKRDLEKLNKEFGELDVERIEKERV